jgi:hypothetical protein
MKRSFIAPMAIALAATTLGLSACKKADTPADSAADMIESTSEATADAVDTMADNMTNGASEAVLHDKADAIRDAGKHKADEVKDAADTSK